MANGKFKVGDKVRWTSGSNKIGYPAVVVSHVGGKVTANFPTIADGNTVLTYNASFFQPEVEEQGNYILIVEKNGKLAPATTPKTYKTYELAEEVGKTMTNRYGGKFFIFKAVAELTAPPKPTVEVKKL